MVSANRSPNYHCVRSARLPATSCRTVLVHCIIYPITGIDGAWPRLVIHIPPPGQPLSCYGHKLGDSCSHSLRPVDDKIKLAEEWGCPVGHTVCGFMCSDTTEQQLPPTDNATHRASVVCPELKCLMTFSKVRIRVANWGIVNTFKHVENTVDCGR